MTEKPESGKKPDTPADPMHVPPTVDEPPPETHYSTTPSPYNEDTVGGPGIAPTHA